MSIYKTIGTIGTKFIGRATLFKYGFNLSPMYRRSTGRIVTVSPDLLRVQIKLPISYKNKNYVNSIFGGSLFSAVDPIPMVQLVMTMWSGINQQKFTLENRLKNTCLQTSNTVMTK